MNSENHVSELDMEDEVVRFWFNSHGDISTDILESYSIAQNNPNIGYFTQLAWAKSHKMGKNVTASVLSQLFISDCS